MHERSTHTDLHYCLGYGMHMTSKFSMSPGKITLCASNSGTRKLGRNYVQYRICQQSHLKPVLADTPQMSEDMPLQATPERPVSRQI